MRREIIGGAPNPSFILNGFQVNEIETHAKGRSHESVTVLIKSPSSSLWDSSRRVSARAIPAPIYLNQAETAIRRRQQRVPVQLEMERAFSQ